MKLCHHMLEIVHLHDIYHTCLMIYNIYLSSTQKTLGIV